MSLEAELQIEQALAAKKPKGDAWKKGPKITKQDLLNAVKNGGELVMSDVANDFGLKTITIGFGKHADKTYEWVHKNDKQYYHWACENVRGFKTKAEAALK